MAEQTQQKDQVDESQESNGGANGGSKALRAAAVAAATGAAAIAARKAMSSRDQSKEGEGSGSKSSGGNDSTIVAMATSGLSAAKDSLLPFAEEAAGAAGEWLGQNGPDFVTEGIVPRFIEGFESASSKD